jgi:hypothetical protein
MERGMRDCRGLDFQHGRFERKDAPFGPLHPDFSLFAAPKRNRADILSNARSESDRVGF